MALVRVESPNAEIEVWEPPPTFLYSWDEMVLAGIEARSQALLEGLVTVLERRGAEWVRPVPVRAKIPKQLEFQADITHRLTPEDLWFHPM